MGGSSSQPRVNEKEQQAVTPQHTAQPTEMSVCTPKELGVKLFQIKDDDSKKQLVDQILDWEGPSKDHLKNFFKEAGGKEDEYENLSKEYEDRKKAKADELAAAQKKSEVPNGFIF